MRNSIRVSLVALAMSASPIASAHEFRCAATATVLVRDVNGNLVLNGDGLPVGIGSIGPVLELHSYPTDVGIQISLTNVASETSVVTDVANGVLAALSTPPPTFGRAIGPGLSLPVGGSAVEWFAVPIASQAECLRAFGGAASDAPVCTDATNERFVVSHDVGSTECRALVVCGSPETAPPPVQALGPPPPPKCAPGWHGVKQFGGAGYDAFAGIALDPQCNVDAVGSTGATVEFATDAMLASFTAAGVARDFEHFAQGPLSGGNAVAVDLAGNRYVLWGGATGTFLTRFDSSGAKGWTQPVTDLWAAAAALDRAGFLYAVGTTPAYEMVVVKFDLDGTRLWTRTIPTPGVHATGTGIALDATGNVVAVGSAGGGFAGHPGAGFDDALVAKLEPGGNITWIQLLGTAGYDDPWGVAVDAAGDAYVTGFTMGEFPGNANPSGARQGFVLKLDSGGNLVWARQLALDGSSITTGVATNAAGDVWAAGWTAPDIALPPLGHNDAFVARWDAAGNLTFLTRIRTDKDDEAYGLAVDDAGDAFVAGRTTGDFGGAAGGWDAAGNPIFLTRIRTDKDDEAYGLAVDDAGDAFVAGRTMGDFGGAGGSWDGFIAKVDPLGNLQ